MRIGQSSRLPLDGTRFRLSEVGSTLTLKDKVADSTRDEIDNAGAGIRYGSLTLQKATPLLSLNDTATNGREFRLQSAVSGGAGRLEVIDQTAAATRLFMDSSGQIDHTANGAGNALKITQSGAGALFSLNAGATERWSFSNAGHIIPGTNATQDLGGSGANRLRTGYFRTSIKIANHLTEDTWLQLAAGAIDFVVGANSYLGPFSIGASPPSSSDTTGGQLSIFAQDSGGGAIGGAGGALLIAAGKSGGPNQAGGNFTITPGLATGNAATGDIFFRGANAGASGSTLQTALNRVAIKGNTYQILLYQATANLTLAWNDPAAARTLTIPDPGANDTFAFLAATQTFTGKTLTSPTINGGTHTAITSLGVRSTGTGAFDLTLANTENLTAGRTLTLTLNDAARTINLAGNLTTTADLITSGAFSLTLTTTAATNVTLPTTGTLATLAGTETLTGKTLGATTLAGTLSRAADQVIDLTGAATRTLTLQNSTVSQVANLDVDGVLLFRNNTAFTMQLTGTPTAARIFTFPDVADDTVVLLAATQTLTNKTLTAPTLSGTVAGTFTLGGTPTLGATLTFADAINIVLNATTGTKIGTAITQKLGFFNATPIVQPSAYTQTYVTADKTHANPLQTAVATTASTQTSPFGYTTAAQADDIVTQLNNARNDILDLKQLVNSVIDDLQALGLAA